MLNCAHLCAQVFKTSTQLKKAYMRSVQKVHGMLAVSASSWLQENFISSLDSYRSPDFQTISGLQIY